MPLEVAVVAIS